MGYCEVNCTLCGVSFAIARLRRADEPFSAAWAYYGEGFTNEDGTGWECSESDCQRITRDGVYGPDYAGDNTGVEHLPSPSCTFASGYNGHRISAEEMKGCRANQCLAKKSFTLVSNQKEWEPEDDDQDFELESDYFLTGAGEGSDAESDVEQITPVRHGVERIYPANIFWDDDNYRGIPFHPTCFEIFKRISTARLGHIDVHGLWRWREIENTYEAFYEDFPHAFAVKHAREQFWVHEPGCEYLAANPIDVPTLSQLLKSCHRDKMDVYSSGKQQRVPYDVNQGIFNFPLNPPAKRPRSKDPPPSTHFDHFMKLPAELRYIVLDTLSSKDIANLRLVTPAFRQLPVILFRKLLLQDMPFLFEAQDMPVGNTDWYHLYRMVKECWIELKGLKNRRRIWRDVGEVVGRIERYRMEGKIVG